METAQLKCSDNREADRAASDDQWNIVAPKTGLLDGMIADRKRLREGGLVRGKTVRDFQQELFRKTHVFAVSARVIVGIADGLDAGRTQQERHRTDTGAGLEAAVGLRAV